MYYQAYTIALGEKNYQSQVFLQWFLEEETQVLIIDERLRMTSCNAAALFLIEQELGKKQ
jgi:ferritin